MPNTTTLSIHWHLEHQPIYSAHFEPNGKGRLATASGDNNVRLWKLHGESEKKVAYLSTLSKHTQAVNVVRFSPKEGAEMLASAGDDGNVILWVPSDSHKAAYGEDDADDKETWRQKHMCRSSTGAEIYDLAWAPNGDYFITGSMDNIARIYSAQTGHMIRQIAEHNHYVQGVAWDPLNEYVATQSSDRSVHIYTLKLKDGTFTLDPHGKVSRMDLPPTRRTTSSSPAPPDIGMRQSLQNDNPNSMGMASPVPSMPGTPTMFSLPMNPPLKAHSRRSSISSSTSLRRSPSPSPALPLPAIKPMESPKLHSLGARNTNIYCNDAMTSFFRRLAFAPDGSLLFTPAGQYKVSHPTAEDGVKTADEVINTVYIYTRAGLNKPPIAHLPGHKKPSIAVNCSPVRYTYRNAVIPTKHITVDTSSADDSIPLLPPPAVSSEMEPPVLSNTIDSQTSNTPPPNAAFALPYRMVYAVATQDAVLIYDTQQQTPLCVVSNLHYAAFTDLTWSPDGLTLLMTSTDGFCSVVVFTPGELGTISTEPMVTSTPTPTPTPVTSMPAPSEAPTTPLPRNQSPFTPRPPTPVRSLSSSSINTVTSMSQYPSASESGEVHSNPTPVISNVPSVGSSHSGPFGVSINTPPATPSGMSLTSAPSSNAGGGVLKRGSKSDPEPETEAAATESIEVSVADKGGDKKRRRIAPTLISEKDSEMK